MKLLFLILTISFCCCTPDVEVKHSNHSDTSHTSTGQVIYADTTSPIKTDVKGQFDFLIEALKYKNLSDSCYIESLKAESNYYRTGDEKYYRKFNRLQKLKVKYAKIGGAAFKKIK